MAFRFPLKWSSTRVVDGVYTGLTLEEVDHTEIFAIQERIAQYMIKQKPNTLYWDQYRRWGVYREHRPAYNQRINVNTGNYLVLDRGYSWDNNPTNGTHHALKYVMNDHRAKAGAYTTSATGYKSAANTPNVSTVTVGYKRLEYIKSTINSDSITSRPLYWNGTEMQEMSDADIDDTFLLPAIYRFTHNWPSPINNKIIANKYSWTPYKIATSNSLTNYTPLYYQRTTDHQGNINYGSAITEEIFKDTNANRTAYKAKEIPETQDQPVDKRKYYLLRYNAGYKAVVSLVTSESSGIQEMDGTRITSAFGARAAYHSMETDNYRIAFNNATNPPDLSNADSVNGYRSMGTVYDTKYHGSVYQKRKVNEDDYRTQEFPAANSSDAEQNNYRAGPGSDGSYTFYVIRY